ncbi:MAG: hypothetical protein R3Y53_11205 [Bacillota bacterium]
MELERNEDNVWIKLSDDFVAYDSNQLKFLKAVELFMKDKNFFVGTASELSSQLSSNDDNFSNKIISKNIKKLSAELKKVDILGEIRRTGTSRLIELTRISDDNDDNSSVPK